MTLYDEIINLPFLLLLLAITLCYVLLLSPVQERREHFPCENAYTSRVRNKTVLKTFRIRITLAGCRHQLGRNSI